MKNRKMIKYIAALLCLCLLTGCGAWQEPAMETPAPVETPADQTAVPVTPDMSESLVVSAPEEIKAELKAAMEQLRQPRVMELSALELENPEIDVKNIYYGITAEAPELKYACDLSAWTEGTALHCQISYMPYKTGDFPADFTGL